MTATSQRTLILPPWSFQNSPPIRNLSYLFDEEAGPSGQVHKFGLLNLFLYQRYNGNLWQCTQVRTILAGNEQTADNYRRVHESHQQLKSSLKSKFDGTAANEAASLSSSFAS